MIVPHSTSTRTAGRKETILEPTITQNSGLYLAQRRLLRRRLARFDWMRSASRERTADVRRISQGKPIRPRIHRDNGR
jgi:hypothetical protein